MLKFPALLSSALLLSSAAMAQPSYTITNLGTLPGFTYSFGYGINDCGQVAGSAQMPTGESAIDHAYIYTGGHMVDIGVLPGDDTSEGYAINNLGQVTGQGSSSALLYSNGTLYDLGKPAGAVCCGTGAGINDKGQIVGTSVGSTYQDVALYSGGAWTDLGSPSAYPQASGQGINNSGVIALTGTAESYPSPTHAFTYASGTYTDLGSLTGYEFSSAFAINSAGVVAGNASIFPGFNSHATFFSSGTVTDLGVLPGDTDAGVYGLNDFKEAVGYSGYHAMYFSPTTGMLNLQSLIPSGTGWVLNNGHGINRQGEIVGTGELNGVGLAFVLTPIPTRILIVSLTALIPQIDCFECQIALTDLVRQIPESLDRLSDFEKAELALRVGLLIGGMQELMAKNLVTGDAGKLVIHQSEELLRALNPGRSPQPPCGFRASVE